MDIEQEILGFTEQGEPMVLYTMINKAGARVRLLNVGASIISIEVPDKNGKLIDVCLGYKMPNTYLNETAAMGKSVGRYANRIAKGKFSLNDVNYTLATNNGVNHLHGGPTGFQTKVWIARVETNRIVFSYTSAPGEEGYPSELGVEAVYDWSDDNELEITYFAKSNDGDTIVNLTNHAYFNLNGESNGTIYDHFLQLDCSKWLPTDETQIPTGEIADVSGTPMDFTTAKAIGKDINCDFEALKIGAGYDHAWVVDNWEKGKLCSVGELYSEESGISMTIKSTQPGVQVYSGNWLGEAAESKTGAAHYARGGVALECQNFPDAPNKPNFPSPILRKDDIYEEHIIYKFSIK
ncbi:MAG: aldose epimerase family protein [Rikenellaceae bacterium]